jgi:hypothetical protein
MVAGQLINAPVRSFMDGTTIDPRTMVIIQDQSTVGELEHDMALDRKNGDTFALIAQLQENDRQYYVIETQKDNRERTTDLFKKVPNAKPETYKEDRPYITSSVVETGKERLNLDQVMNDLDTFNNTVHISNAEAKELLTESLQTIAAQLGTKPEDLTFCRTKTTFDNDGIVYFYRINEDPLARIIVFVTSDYNTNRGAPDVIINHDWSSFDFQSGEFDGTMKPENLINALRATGINIPAAHTTDNSFNIDLLNKLLESTDLYTVFENKGMKAGPDAAQGFVNTLKAGLQLNVLEIKEMNRLLIEANYPSLTPKRTDWAGKDAYLSYEFSYTGEIARLTTIGSMTIQELIDYIFRDHPDLEGDVNSKEMDALKSLNTQSKVTQVQRDILVKGPDEEFHISVGNVWFGSLTRWVGLEDPLVRDFVKFDRGAYRFPDYDLDFNNGNNDQMSRPPVGVSAGEVAVAADIGKILRKTAFEKVDGDEFIYTVPYEYENGLYSIDPRNRVIYDHMTGVVEEYFADKGYTQYSRDGFSFASRDLEKPFMQEIRGSRGSQEMVESDYTVFDVRAGVFNGTTFVYQQEQYVEGASI